MFRAYLECRNKEFVDAIKDERRKWTQGNLGTSYSYRDLMDLGRLTYKYLLDENTWSAKPQTKPTNDEKKYLALATQLMSQMKAMQDRNNGNQGNGGNEAQGNGEKQQSGDRTYLSWRYENPYNKATK